MVGRSQEFYLLSFSIHLEIMICIKHLFHNSNSCLKCHIQHFGCLSHVACILFSV